MWIKVTSAGTLLAFSEAPVGTSADDGPGGVGNTSRAVARSSDGGLTFTDAVVGTNTAPRAGIAWLTQGSDDVDGGPLDCVHTYQVGRSSRRVDVPRGTT